MVVFINNILTDCSYNNNNNNDDDNNNDDEGDHKN